MPALTNNSSNEPVAQAPKSTLEQKEFRHALAAALDRVAEGHPNALLQLEVARAGDIYDCYGDHALTALRSLLGRILYTQLGPDVPTCDTGMCGLLVLLENCLSRDALIVAKRLRGAVDQATFRWHGHPFRLGAHLGVLELGQTPSDPEAWLARARQASSTARELGGTGIQLVEQSGRAWRDIDQEREWHDHLTEILG